MPRPIGVIQIPGRFESILRRLGVNRPTQPFMIDGDVTPVVLVDSGVEFTAAPLPPYGVTDIFTAGVVVQPAVNAILADTGPLPIGSYILKWIAIAEEPFQYRFEWRDAPNAANLWSQFIRSPTNNLLQFESRFLVENANERFRIINLALGAININHQSSILAKP